MYIATFSLLVALPRLPKLGGGVPYIRTARHNKILRGTFEEIRRYYLIFLLSLSLSSEL
jgi:hypothetical protein